MHNRMQSRMQSSLALAEPMLHAPVKRNSALTLQVQVHHDDEDLVILRADWEELLEHCAQCVAQSEKPLGVGVGTKRFHSGLSAPNEVACSCD